VKAVTWPSDLATARQAVASDTFTVEALVQVVASQCQMTEARTGLATVAGTARVAVSGVAAMALVADRVASATRATNLRDMWFLI
jgi:hypothetical protein